MKHRSEIDGLRAVAVIPVILFHAGTSIFSGGFIGVDVFFVISGYLITRLILEELAAGRFSLRQFYIRRARRILPALLAVIFATTVGAFILMLPTQYADFSLSSLAVLLFISNVFFWQTSGYFAPDARELPLLHTWSLGIEEQYYMLFPLMLMLVWRLGKRSAFFCTFLAAIVSFALCEYASHHYINSNYFLIPFRAWELLAGSLCAFFAHGREIKKRNVPSALGLLLIILSIMTYSESLRFPSAYALIPVLGTALVLLYATAGSWVERILSWRPLVAIGLISYSAYLWHQPLFALARIGLPSVADTYIMLILALVALILGALTWRFIEQPFRNKNHPYYVTNYPAFILGLVAILVIGTISAKGYVTHGFLTSWSKHRSADQVRAFELAEAAQQALVVRFHDNGDCIFNVITLDTQAESRLTACQKKYGQALAVIGDSHSIDLYVMLKARAKSYSFIIGISQGACRAHAPNSNCFYDQLLTLLKKKPSLFHDIIYEQSGIYLFNDNNDKALIAHLMLGTPVPDYAPNTQRIDEVATYLSQLAKYSRVTWFGPRIEPQIKENSIVQMGCNYPFVLRPNQAEVFRKLDDAIRARLMQSTVRYVSQIDMLNLQLPQDLIDCNAIYFSDFNHYSPAGKERFSTRITQQKILSE